MAKKAVRKNSKRKMYHLQDTCYTDWVGRDDEFDCPICNEPLEYPAKKCTDCGTTFIYNKASLELVMPVIKQRRREFPVAPGLVGPSTRVNFTEKPSTGFFEGLICWWRGHGNTLSGGRNKL